MRFTSARIGHTKIAEVYGAFPIPLCIISAHSHYLCTLPLTLHTPTNSAHSHYLCTLPLTLHTPTTSAHSHYLCTLPLTLHTPTNCTLPRHTPTNSAHSHYLYHFILTHDQYQSRTQTQSYAAANGFLHRYAKSGSGNRLY